MRAATPNARALQPFSLNPTGTLLRRHLAHFVAAVDTGQKQRVTEQIKRELRRRSAVEPVIGHLKAEHRMGRNHLAHAQDDAINAVLAAAGYNFRRLLAWLALWLAAIWAAATPEIDDVDQPIAA